MTVTTSATPTDRITKVCEDCKATFLTPPGNPQVVQCQKCWDLEDAACAAIYAPKGTETDR